MIKFIRPVPRHMPYPLLPWLIKLNIRFPNRNSTAA